jgi:hypothetical protein
VGTVFCACPCAWAAAKGDSAVELNKAAASTKIALLWQN